MQREIVLHSARVEGNKLPQGASTQKAPFARGRHSIIKAGQTRADRDTKWPTETASDFLLTCIKTSSFLSWQKLGFRV